MRCVNFASQIDANQKGVWRFRRFFNTEVATEFRLTAREGRTPLELLILGSQRIWLKREDLNPHGSHKDRSLAYQVSLAYQEDARELVISSSGNAAIAAAAYCRLAGIKLWAFLSPTIPRQKYLAVKESGAEIVLSHRAMRMANYLAKKKKTINLRPSLNDDSIVGFKTLGFEIFEQSEKIRPIFTFVTSGSSLVGIFSAFQKLKNEGCVEKLPELHAVQSVLAAPSETPVADELVWGLAGQGGIRRTRRANQIAEATSVCGGRIWRIADEEIKEAARQLSRHNVKTSWEGCASLAAVLKSGEPEAICILTGRFYDSAGVSEVDKIGVRQAENIADLDRIIFHA